MSRSTSESLPPRCTFFPSLKPCASAVISPPSASALLSVAAPKKRDLEIRIRDQPRKQTRLGDRCDFGPRLLGRLLARLEPQREAALLPDDPDLRLDDADSAKVHECREAYSAQERNKAFLPAISSTSGHIHGEFLLTVTPLHSLPTPVKIFDTFGQSSSSTPLGKSHPPKFSPSAAPNISSTCGQLSSSIVSACAQATAPSARTWLPTLSGVPLIPPFLARCTTPTFLPPSLQGLSQLSSPPHFFASGIR